MSKVKIQGHASGTGVFTLTSPNSSTDRTITLPDGSGTLAFTTGDDDKLPLSGGTMTGDLILNDNVKLEVGSASGGDLQIYHNGSHSYISDQGTGNLHLLTNHLSVNNAADDEAIIHATQDAGVSLFHNGAKKFETTAIGANIINDQGNVTFITRAEVGASSNWSGGGFEHVANATAGSRRAMMWLDADGGNYGGSDYYYIEKTGGGDVQHILQNSADMKFATGGTTRMIIDATGVVTKPAQPAFYANAQSLSGNLPINTDTAVVFNNERYDVNADYNNSNYTFTAPVTGKYHFDVQVLFDNWDSSANYIYLQLITSNRTHYELRSGEANPGDPQYSYMQVHSLADMDAGDTAYVNLNQNGGASEMGYDAQSFFSGYLAC